MDALKSWGFNICLAIIVAGVVQSLAPSENMRRTLKVTVSVFLVACIVSPLKLISGISERDVYGMLGKWDAPAVQGGIDEQLLRASEKTLEELIREKVEDFQVYPEDVAVEAGFDEMGAIYPKGIIITVSPEYIDSKYAITERLKLQLGLDCEVVTKDIGAVNDE